MKNDEWLSHAVRELLLAVERSPDAESMYAFGKMTGMSTTTIYKAFLVLEKERLVIRVRTGRNVRIVIQERGREISSKVHLLESSMKK